MTTETPQTNADAQPNSETKPPEGTNLPEGAVSKAEYEKVMADLHKFKRKATELEGKAKKEEEERLRATGEWQKIAELKAKEAEEKEEKLNQIQKSIVEDKKFTAIREAAIKAGMTEQALKDLELLSFRDVIVETTSTGRVNVLGVDRFIESQKTVRPHWFGKPQLNINGKIPTVTADKVATEKELVKMSLEAEKTGDYTAYQNKLKEFQKQNK